MGRTDELKNASNYVYRKEEQRRQEEYVTMLWVIFGSLVMAVGIMMLVVAK